MRAKLAGVPGGQAVSVGVSAPTPDGVEVDVCCFGLDGQGRLSDDSYFIFYNQAESPCGAMALAPAPVGERQCFRIQFARLPQHVRHLVITASIDGEGVMSDLQPGYLRISHAEGDIARFAFRGADFALEKSIILAELYERDGSWRLWAVGQGFNGGLDALLQHYGGTAAEAPPPPDIPAPKLREGTGSAVGPTPPPVPTPQADPPPKGPASHPPVPPADIAPPPPAVPPAATPAAPSLRGEDMVLHPNRPGFFTLDRAHRRGSVRVLVDGERIPTSAVIVTAEQTRAGCTGYAIEDERVCGRSVVRVDFDEAD